MKPMTREVTTDERKAAAVRKMQWTDFMVAQTQVLHDTLRQLVLQWPTTSDPESQPVVQQVCDKVRHDAVYRDPEILQCSLEDVCRALARRGVTLTAPSQRLLVTAYQTMAENWRQYQPPTEDT